MAEELEFHTRGMRYCAKAWGPVDGEPILALHGWLDNGASFDEMAKHFGDYRLVAVDLPGHGWSDHFPPQASYNIWDDLTELLCILNDLKWEKCHLLGHSRGATVCFLLAMVAPERVASLSMMEGVLPVRFVDTDPAVQLGMYVKDNLAKSSTKVPVYKKPEDAIKARALKTNVPEHVVRPIVLRALKEDPEGWTWRSDPRLTGASAVKLDDVDRESFLKAMDTPAMLALAEDGFAKITELDEQAAMCKNMKVSRMPGHHHFHMDEQAGPLAELFIRHMQRYPLR